MPTCEAATLSSTFRKRFFFGGSSDDLASWAAAAAAASSSDLSPSLASPSLPSAPKAPSVPLSPFSAAGAAAGAASAVVSLISSMSCAEETDTHPLRLCLTLTRILGGCPVLEAKSARSLGTSTVKVPMLGSVPGGRSPRHESSYEAPTVKLAARLKVTFLAFGVASFFLNSTTLFEPGFSAASAASELSLSSASSASAVVSAPGPEAASQLSLTGKLTASKTWNSLTRKRVESKAACQAVPRATASSAFIVVCSPLFIAALLIGSPAPMRMSASRSLTKPRRVVPPTISTVAMSAGGRPDSPRACMMGGTIRASSGSDASMKSARVRVRLKSISSMRHSQPIRASETPAGLSVFLAFSAAASSFMRALGFSHGSPPCFALKASLIFRAMITSNSRPPRLRSWAAALTESLPVWNAATVALKVPWPKSRNMQPWGFSASKRPLADLNMPYSRATAVPSCRSRRQLSCAISHALTMARRWASVYHPGMEMTVSVGLAPVASSVMATSLASIMATHCSMLRRVFSSLYITSTPTVPSSSSLYATPGVRAISSWISGSANLRPRRRLMLSGVFL
mmetsp:Transcript_21111/g.47627  ORF Transcript_21111/g.47627 Transcript_21111/m.47627 type:complete len:571 (+) Transcript_21111:1110-2822(+)